MANLTGSDALNTYHVIPMPLAVPEVRNKAKQAMKCQPRTQPVKAAHSESLKVRRHSS